MVLASFLEKDIFRHITIMILSAVWVHIFFVRVRINRNQRRNVFGIPNLWIFTSKRNCTISKILETDASRCSCLCFFCAWVACYFGFVSDPPRLTLYGYPLLLHLSPPVSLQRPPRPPQHNHSSCSTFPIHPVPSSPRQCPAVS